MKNLNESLACVLLDMVNCFLGCQNFSIKWISNVPPPSLLTLKSTGFILHVEEVYLQEYHVAQLTYMLNVLLHFLKQAFFSLPITNSLKQLTFSAQQVLDDLNYSAKYYF